ncbi:4-hydroxybenzoate synthetase [Paenibacillus beijingensis]|uniref:4-hydroxybenzoate synthetase n=2 Tax=Paenibacillus beijingensis TaxID=1126833 RepID=A0A0D5NQ73_9BACL|nr:4-hydroxybenzoate synthetase [Paenibacillus beijingensis]
MMDMDSPNRNTIFEFLHRLLFEILLRTDGRTTDILETLMDETMSVHVIRQEQINEEHAGLLGESSGAPYYIRESILISNKTHFVVSHNIALVCSKFVPAPMFEAISSKHEGIGKTVSALGLPTSRKVADFGWRNEQEAVDLFQKPIKLHFARENERSPFKKYAIYFESVPGIYLLEYFNPDLLRHRLKQVLNEQQRTGE